jgi:acetyl esterase
MTSMTTHYCRQDVRDFLDMVNAAPGPSLEQGTPERAREMASQAIGFGELPVGDIAVMRDLSIPAPDGRRIAARLFDPRAERDAGPLLLFFHGGGFVLGDIAAYTPVCAEIARTLDLPLLSIEYSLAPERPWPCAPDDCETAARWAAGMPVELGREIDGLVTLGDSAGGGLAIVTSLALRDAPAALPVIAQCAIYPAVDLSRTYPSVERLAAGYLLTAPMLQWYNQLYAAQRDHWRASPILADLAGLPPTLILGASLDPLIDQARAYAAASVLAGVPTVYREAAGTIHGFLNLRRAIPSAVNDVDGMLLALKAMITEARA